MVNVSDVHIRFFPSYLLYDTPNRFRTMELDRKIYGVAYIGRIKPFDNFKCEDELYGIVHRGDSEIDYNLFSSICNTHNKKYFYSRKVNKNTNYFTMRECMSAALNFPMVGKTGISSGDQLLSFAEFGKFAYSKSILVSQSGYKELCVDDKRNTDLDEADNTIPSSKQEQLSAMIANTQKNAASCMSGVGAASNETKVFPDDVDHEETVSGDSESGYTNVTLDTLKKKCASDDSLISDLNAKLHNKDNEIETLKTQLQSLKESNTQFMSASDLQEARSRASRADNASEIIEGLKEELNIIKGLSNKFATMSKDINKQKDKHDASMLLISECVRTLHDKMAVRYSMSL